MAPTLPQAPQEGYARTPTERASRAAARATGPAVTSPRVV